MDNVGNIALSHAAMMGRATDITANNIANANTDGFKAARISFEKMVIDTGSKDVMAKMSYGIDKGSWTDLSSGALLPTGNSLDMAIQGEGFFAYERADGRLALGRSGSFAVTAEGELATPTGARVLDIGGAPIQVPADGTEISVAADGTISAGGQVIAQLGVFSQPGIAGWQHLDGGMMVPREGEIALTPVMDPRVLQGHSEASNVSPVLEMTRMIEDQRAFERAVNMADAANELRGKTIQRLGSRS